MFSLQFDFVGIGFEIEVRFGESVRIQLGRPTVRGLDLRWD